MSLEIGARYARVKGQRIRKVQEDRVNKRFWDLSDIPTYYSEAGQVRKIGKKTRWKTWVAIGITENSN